MQTQLQTVVKTSAGTVILALAVLLSGCASQQVTFRGRVVSYDWLRLSQERIHYFYGPSGPGLMQQSTAPISPDGEFTIQLRHIANFPYSLEVDSLNHYPWIPVSPYTSWAIRRNHTSEIDLGTFYIYDPITVIGVPDNPVSLANLSIVWKTNVPDVSSYEIELLVAGPDGLYPAIDLSGIRTRRVSFNDFARILSRPGAHHFGDIQINVVRSFSPQKVYSLTVYGVRVVAGHATRVAASASLLIRFLGN